MQLRTGGPLLHAQTGGFSHNRHRRSTSGRAYIFLFVLAAVASIGGIAVYATFHSLGQRAAEQDAGAGAGAGLHRRGARHVLPKHDAEVHSQGKSHVGHAMRHAKAIPTATVTADAGGTTSGSSPDKRQQLKRSLLTNAKSPIRSMYHTGGTRGGLYHTVKDRQQRAAAHGGAGGAQQQHGGNTGTSTGAHAPVLEQEGVNVIPTHSPVLEKHAPNLKHHEGIRTTHHEQHHNEHAPVAEDKVAADAQRYAEALSTQDQVAEHHGEHHAGHHDAEQAVASEHLPVAGDVHAAGGEFHESGVQQHAADEHAPDDQHASDLHAADQHVTADQHVADQHATAEHHAAEQHADQHGTGQHAAAEHHAAEQHADQHAATQAEAAVDHQAHDATQHLEQHSAEQHVQQHGDGVADQQAAVVEAGHDTDDVAAVHAPANAATSLFELSALTIDGVEQSLEIYRGKVVLVVNVASACGFTDTNYKGLTRTYSKYKTSGFVVLGFPCNQFGAQESGTDADIKSFCTDKYNVDFPMFSKVDVNGEHAHPVFRFLRHRLPAAEGGGGGDTAGKDLTWNFNKFLVDPLGHPVKLYGSEYDLGEIESDIYDLLKAHSSNKAQQHTTTTAVEDAGGATHGVAPADAPTSLFDLSAINIDGHEQSLAEFRNKVVMVVNVASACGYTDTNYKGLQETYTKYKGNGFTILGFPCNQFGGQESGTNREIRTFCTDKYHVDFPMFSKVDVNGDSAHPVFKFLRHHLPTSEGGGGSVSAGKELSWNFNKFLLDKSGRPVKLFGSEYDVGAIESEIYRLLKAS